VAASSEIRLEQARNEADGGVSVCEWQGTYPIYADTYSTYGRYLLYLKAIDSEIGCDDTHTSFAGYRIPHLRRGSTSISRQCDGT
jgi:hypothetical protein